jgi:hypothetical protein
MKTLPLALLLMLFIVKTSEGQNTQLDYQSALKIYNLSTYEEQTTFTPLSDTSSYRQQNTTTSLQLLRPSIAFQWKSKKNNFHEIELISFSLGKNGTKSENINDSTNTGQLISSVDFTSTVISVRYEYILNFNKSKESKFVPSIGFGANPYFRKNDIAPKTSNAFPSSETAIGMRAFITPRLSYYFTSKLFLDVNIPLCLFDNAITTIKNENPSIPISQQKISAFDFSQFPRLFSGRIGIGIKL